MEPIEEPPSPFRCFLAGNKIDNMCDSTLWEPKEEPLDDFLLMPAENETFTHSNSILKEEVKEEPIDSVDSIPFENEIPDKYSMIDNYRKKEEIKDEEPSPTVKNEPIVDEYIQDLVRLGQIPAWDAELDQSARYGLFPHESKPEDAKLEVSVVEKTTPQCVPCPQVKCILCEAYPRTLRGYMHHLSRNHKDRSTLIANEIYLICSCGFEIRSESRNSMQHIKNCGGSEFSVHKLERKAHSTPQCIMCEAFPKTTGGYIEHLRKHHKEQSTLKLNGIYLLCACGLEVRTQIRNHSKECEGSEFTLHKLKDNEKRKRQSKNVSKPLRYRDSVEDSDGFEEPPRNKSTTKMMKHNANQSPIQHDPKGESLDLFVSIPEIDQPLFIEEKDIKKDELPDDGEISNLYLTDGNDCKKEEIIDALEVSNLATPSDNPVKEEPVDEYIQDLVRFGQIPAWDAKLDQSARYGITPRFPIEPKSKEVNEEIPGEKNSLNLSHEERTKCSRRVLLKQKFIDSIEDSDEDILPILGAVVDQSSSLAEGRWVAVEEGGYIAKENILNLAKEEEETSCSRRVTQKRKFIESIEDSDDEDIKNDPQYFNQNDPSEILTPQCIFCKKYPVTAFAYAYHIIHHHKYSLITNGICLLCSCGVKVLSNVPHRWHKCDGRDFTLRKLDGIE